MKSNKNIVRLPGFKQTDVVYVRGIPHHRDSIAQLEKALKAKLVTDEAAMARYDALVLRHIKETGHSPKIIVDPQTRSAVVLITGIVDPDRLRVMSKIYFIRDRFMLQGVD